MMSLPSATGTPVTDKADKENKDAKTTNITGFKVQSLTH